MMDHTKTSSFSSWIFSSFRPTAEALGLYRVFCGVFLLLFLLPPLHLYPFISSLPNDFFLPPPGLMALFDGFPAYGVFLFLHGLLIISLCAMTVGWKTRSASLLSGFLLLIIKGFMYSVGKINHDFLIVIVPVLMAFSGWGSAYSVDSCVGKDKQKAEGWTLTLLALFIGFMFFTAGFSKILGGWLYIDSQATLSNFFKQYFVQERQDLLAGSALRIHRLYVWEIFDYMTVIFETSFILAIFYRRAVRIYICLAVLFHFSIMMVLNISFLPNFLAYAAFLNWDAVNRMIKNSTSGLRSSIRKKIWLIPVVVGLMLTGLFIITSLLDEGKILASDWGMPGLIVVTIAVLIALYHLFGQLTQVFKKKKSPTAESQA